MSKRSKVPKWINREEAKPVTEKAKKLYNNPMNFEHRDGKRPRPAQNKGRFEQGGWAMMKSRRSGG